jgi:hypothetical protein
MLRCMRRMQLRSTTLVLLAAVVASGCGFAGIDEQPTLVDLSTTCEMWGGMAEGDRIALADRVVDSPELLESVRKAQRQPEGTSRDRLLLDVVGSVTKGCDVWAPPAQPVIEVVTEIYLR